MNHRDRYYRAQGKEGKKEKRARTEDDGEDSRKAAKEQAADGEAEE